MTLRKTAIDSSVKYIPQSERSQPISRDNKPTHHFLENKTKQRTFTKFQKKILQK